MTVDLSAVPLVALSVESKQVISTLLNPPKVIPSENGLPRDWRGLAHLCNLKIDRWDILNDTLELFEKDAERYLEQVQKSQTSAEVIANDIDAKVLTVGKNISCIFFLTDDLHRVREGLENQYYDAFLLYADEDTNFATEMVDKLENEYKLKLCLKDRDLIGGVTFEYEAVMTLISERCNRLIVIVSPNFLKSSANKFFLSYAQALGIDKRQRKVVPCVYKQCQLPPQLNYMFKLDYNRVGLYDFWGKLRDSVRTPGKINGSTNSSPMKENFHSNLNVNDKSEKDEKDEKDEKNIKHIEPLQVNKLQSEDNKETLNIEKNSSQSSFDNVNSSKDNNKKYTHFLQWTKKKWSKIGENNKKEYVPITETVSLPSLKSLDTLSASAESMEKKHKTKFINKSWHNISTTDSEKSSTHVLVDRNERRRPVNRVLQQIKYLRRSVHLLIPKVRFARLVREIIIDYFPRKQITRLQVTALQALQEAAEAYLVEFFEDTILMAHHAKRITIKIHDMILVRRLRGRRDVINK
ncbi:Myeloid differentiation primary response protein MyD88 [Habropoda laboriosa]|uniref:Myeloid differentiation primary response protein MyD88 n=1 Tax=Habropoda laboriosa TaxID=597456 RepID=A0A0L7RJK4_9HYME|nr:Myeloid differentiation primary response protein MyD88 [Habropoda laboriosa]